MAKSYTRQLKEWVGRARRPTKPDRNRVAFMAVKYDVREALEEGWPLKTIWAHMVEQKRIEFAYETFLVYVKRHVKSTTEPSGTNTASRRRARSIDSGAQASGQPKADVVPTGSDQRLPGPEPMSGFTFTAAPKREDLI